MPSLRQSFAPCRSSFAGLALVALFTACTRGSTEPVSQFDGSYPVSQVDSAASCSPQALPAPALDDSTRYVHLPQRPETLSVQMVVRENTSVVSLTQLASPAIATTLTIVGSADSDSLSYSSPAVSLITEGPRQGGHTFTVTTQAQVGIKFQAAHLLPPGTGVQVSEVSSGSRAYTFIDGGSGGQVYTTCVTNFTSTGSRASP